VVWETSVLGSKGERLNRQIPTIVDPGSASRVFPDLRTAQFRVDVKGGKPTVQVAVEVPHVRLSWSLIIDVYVEKEVGPANAVDGVIQAPEPRRADRLSFCLPREPGLHEQRRSGAYCFEVGLAPDARKTRMAVDVSKGAAQRLVQIQLPVGRQESLVFATRIAA
jgi:hypothetical protein